MKQLPASLMVEPAARLRHCATSAMRRLASATSVAGAVACALGWPSSALADLASLSPIAGLREEVVLRGAVVAGRRMDLNRFTDSRSPEALREEVRGRWAHRPAPLHALERDGWLVLVQALDGAIEMIEMRGNGSGSEGRRSRLSRPGGDAAADSRWLEEALPPGSRILDRITHQDGGRRMTTLVALSSRPAIVLSSNLLATLGRHGFVPAPRGAPSFAGAAGLVRFLARPDEELALTISEQSGERAVVMHWGRTSR